MKKLVLLAAVIGCVVASNAQDVKKVFGSPTLVYYGLDFSKAKMIGFGDESPHKVRDEYFRQWNMVSVDLDLAKTFQKNAVYKDPNGLQKLNLARETESLMGDAETELTPSDLADVVKTVPVGLKKEGLGCVFIVQSFNKTSGMAAIWVTFFDIATHEVLWAKKMTAKSSGSNPKTAWGPAVKAIFDQIEKKEFTAWRKEAKY